MCKTRLPPLSDEESYIQHYYAVTLCFVIHAFTLLKEMIV